jgi:ABC-type branched-subunit amino acid transport system ATPase component
VRERSRGEKSILWKKFSNFFQLKRTSLAAFVTLTGGEQQMWQSVVLSLRVVLVVLDEPSMGCSKIVDEILKSSNA